MTRPLGQARTGASYTLSVPISTHQEPWGSKTRTVVDHSVFIGAMEVDGAWFGKVETNPSRYGDPRGCSLLAVEDLPEALDEISDLANAVVANIVDLPGDWKVKRLDLARDFREVPDTALFVRSLQGLPRPYARRSFTYRDPRRNRAQTLAVGSGAGMVRLYDQWEAYASKGAPEGSLRWEVECREAWLHEAAAGDLAPAFLGALGGHRWEWSACGTPVATSEAGFVAAIEARTCRHRRPRQRCEESCDGLAPATASRLRGDWMAAQAGIGTGLSNRSRRRYAMEARRLGLVLDPEAADDAADRLLALDWESGTVLEV